MRLTLSGRIQRERRLLSKSARVTRLCSLRNGHEGAGNDGYSPRSSQITTTPLHRWRHRWRLRPTLSTCSHQSINPILAVAKCFSLIHCNACNTIIPGSLPPLLTPQKTTPDALNRSSLTYAPHYHFILFLYFLLPSRISC